jgi:glycosyltransferase involved in cell wall biosynthesis
MIPSQTHLVLIPAFNPGRLLAQTVAAARAQWDTLWVIVDGSTDRSHEGLGWENDPGIRVIVLPANHGKGAAVLAGTREALAAGFTHALVMDADGQHPAARIPDFMSASRAAPDAVICGKPVFGPDAPWIRLLGRKLSIALVRLEAAGKAAADPLFGFRVYPLDRLVRVLSQTQGARRYDFDPEVAVRLAWAGAPAVNIDAHCLYVGLKDGGVSHFRYLRDNLWMIAMHARLLGALLIGRTNPHSA